MADTNAPPGGDQRNAGPTSHTPYIYVTTRQRLTNQEQTSLKGVGVRILSQSDPTRYICRYEPSNLRPVLNFDAVLDVKDYGAVDKTGHELENTINSLSDPNETSQINVVLHRDVTNTDSVADRIKQINGVDGATVHVMNSVISLNATPLAIDSVKHIVEVASINPVVPMEPGNDHAVADLHIGAYTQYTAALDGTGQSILINDTGFDLGDINDVHPAYTGHVTRISAYWPGASAEDTKGHGTHVAGSVGADGQSNTMGGRIAGVATGAALLVQSVIDKNSAFNPPSDYAALLQSAYDDHNVRTSNNSWGQNWSVTPRQLTYGTSVSDETLDKFVWTHPDMVVVVSAGNDGRESSPAQISSAAAAKNCITVGATYSSRPSTTASFKYIPATNTLQTTDTIAAFSSKGPTEAGRIKPDVVAPGVAILSGSSRSAAFLASGKASQYGVSNDPLFRFSSGTSMAAPLVSGCCAVIRQMLIDSHPQDPEDAEPDLKRPATSTDGKPVNGTVIKGPRAPYEPSAALVKAVLINGALAHKESHDRRDCSSVHPDGSFGWGRVDMDHAIFTPHKTTEADLYEDQQGLLSGSEHSMTIHNGGGKANLKVTLVWSDPPGPLLNNPLGLDVYDVTDPTAPVFLGAGFDHVTNAEPTDNVQQVIVHGLRAKQAIRFRVKADWPFEDHDVRQPFGLVWALT